MPAVKQMVLQKQPNMWTCLITSFAMCLDKPVEELIKTVGHDGSGIFDDTVPEPWNRCGYHYQELIDLCLLLNRPVVEIHAHPLLAHFHPDAGPPKHIWPTEKCVDRFCKYLDNNYGVLYGLATDAHTGHAVAWNGEKAYDPRGWIRDAESCIIPQIFFLFAQGAI